MKIDDSFKKPGSVPFKWEIRPGVPKLQAQSGRRQLESGSEKQHQRKQKQHPLPETPRKLKPPPAGLYLQPPMDPQTRTRSLRSSPHSLSDRFGHSGRARPDVVSSAGCFPSPLGKLKNVKGARNPRSISEPEYYSDLETSSRWSVSSRKSVSPLSPSIPSHRWSPRPVSNAEWAGFGLF
ncbi:uncharacterized protein LOC131011848 [Salvia miltiorrhiza]|uniref:uncharacterized protein LOC131011848 n=1 Tax=Salvia miltiorrhiza TaxID=226208 RepID=UPI0025ACD786|nr:uncharacterized protein LOC131011848 [Salvia miltiorrhiza]